jgi:hypothetical protein
MNLLSFQRLSRIRATYEELKVKSGKKIDLLSMCKCRADMNSVKIAFAKYNFDNRSI